MLNKNCNEKRMIVTIDVTNTFIWIFFMEIDYI